MLSNFCTNVPFHRIPWCLCQARSFFTAIINRQKKWWTAYANQSLSVMPMEPHGQDRLTFYPPSFLSAGCVAECRTGGLFRLWRVYQPLAGLTSNSIGRHTFIAHYLIFHSLGLRFSRKALIPSLASSVADIDTPMLFKYSMALLIGISAAL